MADREETIADIIAEKRREAEQIRNNLSTVLIRKFHQEAVKSLEDEANRLEAALKRERATAEKSSVVGNAAAMREALKAAKTYLDGYTVNVLELRRTVDAALDAPPRNCDRFGGDNAKLQKVYYSECGKEYEPQDPNSRQAYLVGYGNWLLAPAKEGGAK